MTRLIDADALLNEPGIVYHTEFGDAVVDVEDIKNAPTITPGRPHGECKTCKHFVKGGLDGKTYVCEHPDIEQDDYFVYACITMNENDFCSRYEPKEGETKMDRLDELKVVELGEKIGYKKGFEDARKQFERPHGEWIPVCERLPEEKTNPITHDFEEVLCTTVWGNVRHYRYGTRIGHDKAHFWYGGEIKDKEVIAWMPLPEPYRKEGESE